VAGRVGIRRRASPSLSPLCISRAIIHLRTPYKG
jgi:hypothetical protein